MHDAIVDLALLGILGIAAQWVAWRLRLPSILILLLTGLLVGPVLGLLDPDALFGELLMPFVSISVALILYEGGFSLHFSELRSVGGTVRNLVTIGAFVTWVLGGAAAWWLLGLELRMAILLGAVLVVTGPTVIQPLLRHIRPRGDGGRILKWEGIVIDPIGALLALLVFEAILSSGPRAAGLLALAAIGKTVLAGGIAGAVFGCGLVELLRRYWVPDHLGSVTSLACALAAYTAANAFQEEAGLVAVTWMGILLANQKRVDVSDIVEFKENLRVLLISSLFLLLSARLPLESLTGLAWREAVFVLALIVVVRPVAVALSTARSPLDGPNRWFVASLAPRGIVAAAVSAIFSIRLEEAGFEGAARLATITFAVIVGTVLVYSIAAPLVARRLGLSEADPQGLLVVGVSPFTRAVARVLESKGIPVLLADTNHERVSEARLEGRRVALGSVLSEHFLDEADLGGLGRLVAATGNDWVNVLAVHRFEKLFGSKNVFQLASSHPDQRERDAHGHLSGRILFGPDASHHQLEDWVSAGGEVKATPITEEFSFESFRERYGEHALPLFVLTPSKKLEIASADDPLEPKPGDLLLSFTDGQEEGPGDPGE